MRISRKKHLITLCLHEQYYYQKGWRTYIILIIITVYQARKVSCHVFVCYGYPYCHLPRLICCILELWLKMKIGIIMTERSVTSFICFPFGQICIKNVSYIYICKQFTTSFLRWIRVVHLFSFLCYVLFVFVLCLVYPMLPVSLNYPFWIGPSVFSDVYLLSTVCPVSCVTSVSELLILDCPFGFL